ncbi:MAG: FtsQ-type POTRA domain-containing protein [Chloroflexi bacterium]|nr:FtsQ-type POTRA domain-containing protein [Chloroflexota bacterium]
MTTTNQSRADSVRGRRQKGKRRKPKRVKQRSKSLAFRSAPPTVSRSSMVQTPGRRKKRKESRRRFILSLPTTGAEVRLPVVPVIPVGWRLISGALVIVLVTVINHLLSSVDYRVSGIQVVGAERLSAQEIYLGLGLTEASIFSIAPAAVLEDLNASFPELVDVSVSVQFPAEVIINVGERQPVIALIQSDRSLWIDLNGVAFKPRGEMQGLVNLQAMDDLPSLQDDEDGESNLMTPAMVEAVLTMNTFVPQATTLLYDSRHGLGWVDPKGWQVYFGDTPENMPSKLIMYSIVVQALEERGITPVFISLEHLDAPYYRLVPEE